MFLIDNSLFEDIEMRLHTLSGVDLSSLSQGATFNCECTGCDGCAGCWGPSCAPSAN